MLEIVGLAGPCCHVDVDADATVTVVYEMVARSLHLAPVAFVLLDGEEPLWSVRPKNCSELFTGTTPLTLLRLQPDQVSARNFLLLSTHLPLRLQWTQNMELFTSALQDPGCIALCLDFLQHYWALHLTPVVEAAGLARVAQLLQTPEVSTATRQLLAELVLEQNLIFGIASQLQGPLGADLDFTPLLKNLSTNELLYSSIHWIPSEWWLSSAGVQARQALLEHRWPLYFAKRRDLQTWLKQMQAGILERRPATDTPAQWILS